MREASPLPALEALRGWIAKASLAITDEALISGSNFALSIVLARWLNAEQYGAYALAFSLFLLSLAGIPATAGFLGKLSVFRAAMDAGMTTLVVIALVNSVVGAYYYLKVLVFMYMREPEPEARVAVPMRSPMMAIAILIAAALVLWIGILPSTTIEVVSASVLRN